MRLRVAAGLIAALAVAGCSSGYGPGAAPSVPPSPAPTASPAASPTPTPTPTPSLALSASASMAPPSGSQTVAALRTFAFVTSPDGGPVACPMFAVGDPVTGTLEGDPTDPLEPIWLRSTDGQRISIVWPAGFSVSFEPDAVLANEKGVVVARAGDTVTLTQVSITSHAGTFADPYLAQGSVFGGCYTPIP